MKFTVGVSAYTRRRRLMEWHDWFAWRPVLVADHDVRWLETVERKVDFACGGDGEYRKNFYQAKRQLTT